MRLGIDASNLRAGGGVTHLVELLRAAEPGECGISEVTVWAGQRTLAQLPQRPWLRRQHEPWLDRALPARLYWQRARLPQLAARACDCLFVPGGAGAGGFRPFVTMSRNLLPFEGRELRRYGASPMALKMLLLRRNQAQTLRRADGVIFLTEHARAVVTAAARLSANHVIIPHGVGQEFFLPPRPARQFSPSDPCKLLYVSKVEPYKHQWQVVAAVAELRRAGVPLRLELIGEPADTRAARQLHAAINEADPQGAFISYRGHVTHAALPGCYQQADMFIFASSCENLPNILLEAMAAGLAIACARRGPMPEILRAGGVYFDPEQPAEIAAALRQLCADQALRARCATTAFALAQGYSWERCARATFTYLAAVGARAAVGAAAQAGDLAAAAPRPTR